MFTPQKSSWSGWSLSARKSGAGSGKVHNSSPTDDGEGKSVVAAEPVTPPLGLALDGDHLPEKASELHKELFEYQYNMGLLLIEKKELISKYEEQKQAIEETKDALKREQAAHLIAMTDVENRENELRKALGVEKQCVIDLEKALREMRAEHAEIKFTADSRLAEASALVSSINEKSLELEVKSRSADAKLAEISRRSSEIERKLQDNEAREAALRRERVSFITERESHDATFSKQREDLREWESKLREAEERVGDRQRILNQREEKANEKDKMYRQKQKDLEELQKIIDEANAALKRKESVIRNRVSELAFKEKEHERLLKNLEMKEKELLLLEEQLKAREEEELQKILDQHNRMVEVKRHEFELECDQKRKCLDIELAKRRSELQKREEDTNHKEEKIVKKEQALEKKSEKLKEREGDIQMKLKDLKDQEKLVRSEEKNLEAEKKQLISEKEGLVSLKDGLEKIRADNEEQLLKIRKEMKQLKLTEEERADYVRLQSELREEINKCRQQKELLLKEAEDLKQQKEMFEKEWEELDDKRAHVEKGLKDLCQEKEKNDKYMRSEEEKLRKEKLSSEDYLKREKEELELLKQSFSATMEHEKLVLSEKAENERSQLLRDFELRMKELESDMVSKLDELENDLHQRMKTFEEEKEREMSNISYLRELARGEMEELKQERLLVGKEREEFVANKKHLEEEQVEIRRDIDQLTDLSQKLKEQREKLSVERERFVSFVEKQSCCSNCCELTREFVLSDLQHIDDLELPQSKFAGDYGKKELSEVSERQNNDASPQAIGLRTPGGTVSWILQKCKTKMFNFSPGKKDEQHPALNLTEEDEEAAVACDQRNTVAAEGDTENDVEFELSFAVQRIQSGDSIRGNEADEEGISVDEPSNVNSKAAEDSQKVRGDVNGRRGTRKVKRTRTMKAVVEDAKAILGKEQQNGNVEESAHTNTQSRDESSLNEKGRSRNGRKRNHDADDDGNSEGVTVGQQPKRRQKSGAVVMPPVEPRYNLRRPKTRESKLSSGQNEEKKSEEAGRVSAAGEINSANAAPAVSVSIASHSRHSVKSGTEVNEQEATKEKKNSMAISEEVNGTPERAREYNDGEESDETEDEEYEHPGEVSIGKKLLKFFTT